jgi:hypothetical protein
MKTLPSFYSRTKPQTPNLKQQCLKETATGEEEDYSVLQKILFREDYDIVALNSRVIGKIHKDELTVKYRESRIETLEMSKKSARNRFEVIQIECKIKELSRERDVVATSNLEEYAKLSAPLLKKYATLRKVHRVLKGNQKTLYSPSEEDLERIECIVEFLELAKNYLKIDYICTGYSRERPWNVCDNCETDLLQYPVEKNGIITCQVCSSQKCLVVPSDDPDAGPGPLMKDNGKSIQKTICEFQGKVAPKVDLAALYASLDDYFERIGLPRSEEIRNLPLGITGKKKGTSISLMRRALTECKYNKLYNFSRFLCAQMWGWVLEDLSGVENEILADDKLLEEGYNMIPEKVKCRSSFIPTQVRLYFHLRNWNVSCERDDFKLPKDISKYNKLLELSCKNVGLKFSPL